MTDKKIREAAEHLGENALWLIKQILIKHDAAILEASKEAIDAAVAKEREACAKVCEEWENAVDSHKWPSPHTLAQEIRARESQ